MNVKGADKRMVNGLALWALVSISILAGGCRNGGAMLYYNTDLAVGGYFSPRGPSEHPPSDAPQIDIPSSLGQGMGTFQGGNVSMGGGRFITSLVLSPYSLNEMSGDQYKGGSQTSWLTSDKGDESDE